MASGRARNVRYVPVDPTWGLALTTNQMSIATRYYYLLEFVATAPTNPYLCIGAFRNQRQAYRVWKADDQFAGHKFWNVFYSRSQGKWYVILTGSQNLPL